jgi:bifunctional non-homologous end joining protein LigD
MAKKKETLTVEGQEVEVSNLDKVMFPKTGFTKGQVIDYYIRISPLLLPHLKDRTITMKRFPNGVDASHFYEKDAPSHTPSWVKTFDVPRKNSKATIRYVVINNLATLVWSANLANLEMHTFLAKIPNIQKPTFIVFDLDPGPPAGILDCAQVALWLREILDHLKLQCDVKVSGSKGIQLYIPINTDIDYGTTGEFARVIAEKLEQLRPKTVVSNMSKALRHGKVFIDWSQNSDFKTTVCVYSLRAKREAPYISMPVKFQELEKALQTGNEESLFFEPEEALERVETVGDLFARGVTKKQKIPRNYSRKLDSIDSISDPLRKTRKIKDAKVATLASSSKATERESKYRKDKPDKKNSLLQKYKAKRDFARTAEPAGKVAKQKGEEHLFVIQKHQASHLHYDFRLEMQGVLRSWAVPKGVPTQKGERRLAMHVEDHPMDYARFEGTIPPGNYGAGTVMVWDIGTYEGLGDHPVRAYHAGKINMLLKGKKLKGQWTLVRAGKDKYGKESWFLLKTEKSVRAIGPRKEDSSALSGRSMKQIETAKDAEWISNRRRNAG